MCTLDLHGGCGSAAAAIAALTSHMPAFAEELELASCERMLLHALPAHRAGDHTIAEANLRERHALADINDPAVKPSCRNPRCQRRRPVPLRNTDV